MDKWVVTRKDLSRVISTVDNKEEAVVEAKKHFSSTHINMCTECDLTEEFSDDYVKLKFNLTFRPKCKRDVYDAIKHLNYDLKLNYTAYYYISRNEIVD